MAQAMLAIRFENSLVRSFEKIIEDCLCLIFDSHRQFTLAVNSRDYEQIQILTENLFSATELLRECVSIVASGHLVGYTDLLDRLINLELQNLIID